MMTAKTIETLPREELRRILNAISQRGFDELYCEIVNCKQEHPQAYKIMKEEDEIRERGVTNVIK